MSMRLTLDSLSLSNFKGTQSRTLDFAGRNAALYGDNAAGKTTVYDAVTWLLFGKDSRGQADFDIKPHDREGNVLDHAAVTSVQGAFTVSDDGGTVGVELTRLYSEKWSRKRGAAEESFDGHVTEFRINGVPTQKREYDDYVRSLCSEDLFRALTSVYFFCQMDWRKRRDLLFEVCHVPDDRTIMDREPDFADLSAALGTKTVDQYKREMAAAKKSLNGARDTIPARMDEVQKTVDECRTYDFAALRQRRDALADSRTEAQAALVQMENGTALAAARNEATAARLAYDQLLAENREYRAKQEAVPDRRPKMEAKLAQMRETLRAKQATMDSLCRMRAEREETIDGYRELWRMQDQKTFKGGVCHACGQVLPAHLLEKARADFEKAVADRKAELEAMGRDAKTNLQQHEARIAELEQEMADISREMDVVEGELAQYQAPDAPVVQDMPGFAAKESELRLDAELAETAFRTLESDSEKARMQTRETIADLTRQIAELDGTLSKEAVLQSAQARLEDLRAEAKAAAGQLNETCKMLDLIEAFTRHKVQYIEGYVNDNFQLVSFKMFREQVNGGLMDCCDVYVNGARFGKGLNTGAEINAGLDIIDVLSVAYGVRVPLFLDGAESVTRLLDVDTQVIRLVVSAADKELRCEYED